MQMSETPIVRSTLQMKWTKELVDNVNQGNPVWSDTVNVAMKTRQGVKEQLQWRVEVSDANQNEMRVRLHWINGRTNKIYWKFQGARRDSSEECVVIGLNPGKVVEHETTFPRYYEMEKYNHTYRRNMLEKQDALNGATLIVKLDIVANVDQNDEVLNDNYNGSVACDLGLILEAGDMADMHLACGEKKFPCHKLILACRSKVFKTLLFDNKDFKENQDDCITIEDFKLEEVEQLLQFTYKEECDFSKADPWAMLALADKYDMESLTGFCSKALEKSLTKENCKEYLDKASFLRAKELVKRAVSVALTNPVAGISDEDWIKWAKNCPEVIVEVVKIKTEK